MSVRTPEDVPWRQDVAVAVAVQPAHSAPSRPASTVTPISPVGPHTSDPRHGDSAPPASTRITR